jgi:DNA helicase-2/ATP-dependent DNA helicase PcrA
MDRQGVDIQHFLDAERSMIIAPAGYGKTHTIIDCLDTYHGDKKILVLTHTHAGIASIREKLAAKKIPTSRYHIETICSFALLYVQTFIPKEQIPNEEDTKALFQYAIEKAIKLFRAKPIQQVLYATYNHLIVDEYQDCSVDQHQMILQLAMVLNTHLLGDPLQGIFDFNDNPINFKDDSFNDFNRNLQKLETPWRWINANRQDLGQQLAAIRTAIETKQDIVWADYPAIEFIKVENEQAILNSDELRRYIYSTINDVNSQSLVLIHPDAAVKETRVNIVKNFRGLRMIEAIDDNDFYKTCEIFDNKSGHDLTKEIVAFILDSFTTTEVKKWFNNDGCLKDKRKDKDIVKRGIIANAISTLESGKTYTNILNLINTIEKEIGCRAIRTEYISIIKSVLRKAETQHITLIQALSENRNIARRIGRKVEGRYVGTTLLTKGLEFDTVIVLHAHKFDYKNLYVALTRCCKRLIVISQKEVFSILPNKEATQPKGEQWLQLEIDFGV